MNRWEIHSPILRGQRVANTPQAGLVRTVVKPATLRFGGEDKLPSNPAPKPGLWNWLVSWFVTPEPTPKPAPVAPPEPTKASAPESVPAVPPKPAPTVAAKPSPPRPPVSTEKPEERYLKRIQTVITLNRPVGEWLAKLQKEATLPTFADTRLTEKLARFMAAQESARQTVGTSNPPAKADVYRVHFNELESPQQDLQQRAMQFFIREFMESPMQNHYPEYFKQRSPQDYHILAQHVDDSPSSFKGAFVDSPEFFLQKMKALEEAIPGQEQQALSELAYDDPFQILSVLIHDQAMEAARRKAFPEPLATEEVNLDEDAEDPAARIKALESALNSIYHPTPANRKAGLAAFIQLALEDRDTWIDKAHDHYDPAKPKT